VTRFRAVQGAGYAARFACSGSVTFIFGAWIYTKYRMYVRIPIETQGLEDAGRIRAEGAPRRHRARLLPIYWYFWKNARNPEYDSARRWLTVVLAGWSGTCSWSATSSTTCGDSAHEHRDRHRAGVQRRRWLRRRVQDLRVGVRLATPVIYVACEMQNWPLFTYHPGTDRVEWLYAPRCGTRAGDVLVRLDRDHADRLSDPRYPRHDAAGKNHQKDSAVAHLDFSGGGGTDSDLRAAILLALGVK
jgi:hypothetical protein